MESLGQIYPRSLTQCGHSGGAVLVVSWWLLLGMLILFRRSHADTEAGWKIDVEFKSGKFSVDPSSSLGRMVREE